MLKRLLALSLVLILSIESFAAVVGDNDGAAFITKAEFDSLKNTFQAQIDQYNSYIDNKIDGAISSYLAGVKVGSYSKQKLLLNDKGVYGSNILKWSSSTTKVWDNQSSKRANEVLDISDFDWDYASDMSKKEWTESSAYYMGYLRGHAEHVGVSSIDDVTYITSKRVKKILSDRSEVWCYERKKMYTSIYLNMTQWTPYRNAATKVSSPGYWDMGGPASVMVGNQQNMKQDATNMYIDTFQLNNVTYNWSNQPKWNYAFTGAVSLTSTELAATWDYELLCPKSTANDYYWDPQDKTSYVALADYDRTTMDSRYSSPVNIAGTTAASWHLNTDIDAVDFVPRTYQKVTIPWCEKHIAHNEMVLKSLLDVNEHNKKIKNGVILFEVDSPGILTITVNADYVGKVYFYVSETPTDTWSGSGIQSFDVSTANKDTRCTLSEFFNDDKGKYIWMIYLPTNTNVEATCKISDAQLLINS